MRHVLLALALALVASAALAANDAKIVLFNELIGPAMKTQSLQLLPNGKLVEEKYDFYDQQPSPHTKAILCSYSSSEVESLVAQASTFVGGLPHIIDEGTPAPVDGPKQMILISQAKARLQSIWYSPTNSNESLQARQFVYAWQSITALLLNCHKA